MLSYLYNVNYMENIGRIVDIVNAKEYLQKNVKVKVDRRLGTNHPKHGFIYMLNYGYIPNTISGDGEELDAYIVGVFEPVEEFDGQVIAVIHRINDDDDKLVVAPKGVDYSDDANDRISGEIF